MILIQHSTIIKFYCYSLTYFETNNLVTLLLQLVSNGSLFNFLQKVRNGLEDCSYENTTRPKILVGISCYMMFLHGHHVIYLSDFKASKFYSYGQSANQTQSIGTSIYMAPEVNIPKKKKKKKNN